MKTSLTLVLAWALVWQSLSAFANSKNPRQKVNELFQSASAALSKNQYERAIRSAEKIRKIVIPGETQYLNRAKQIIDKARGKQQEEFSPFIVQANERYAQGDFAASRDLCEEMLKRDSEYLPAKRCLERAKRQLAKLLPVRGFGLSSRQ